MRKLGTSCSFDRSIRKASPSVRSSSSRCRTMKSRFSRWRTFKHNVCRRFEDCAHQQEKTSQGADFERINGGRKSAGMTAFGDQNEHSWCRVSWHRRDKAGVRIGQMVNTRSVRFLAWSDRKAKPVRRSEGYDHRSSTCDCLKGSYCNASRKFFSFGIAGTRSAAHASRCDREHELTGLRNVGKIHVTSSQLFEHIIFRRFRSRTGLGDV